MRTSTYILAILFVILLALVIITGQCNKREGKPNVPENYLQVDSLSVTKVVIHPPKEEAITLAKEREQWMVTEPINYPANQDYVGELLSKADHFELLSLISTNQEKQSLFSVDEENGTLIEFYKDEKLLDKIIIGKMTSAGAATFVRKPDSDKVYQAQGALKSIFSKSLQNWRNKTLFESEKEAIRQIDIQYPDQELSLVRGDTTWTLVADGQNYTLDEKKVESILRTASKFSIYDFIDDPSPAVLEAIRQPYAVVSIYPFNSQVPTQIIFAESQDYENRYVVMKEQNTENLFTTYQSIAKRLLQRKEDFLK